VRKRLRLGTTAFNGASVSFSVWRSTINSNRHTGHLYTVLMCGRAWMALCSIDVRHDGQRHGIYAADVMRLRHVAQAQLFWHIA